MIPGAVFDCMVFLQAAARPSGPAFACFELADHGRIQLYVSPRILHEVSDVLCRPELRRKFPLLTPVRVATFLERVERRAIIPRLVPHVFSLARDPKDEEYVNVAVATQASYLVTRDNDLLDLMDQRTPDGRDFRIRYPQLRILSPPDLLREPTLALS